MEYNNPTKLMKLCTASLNMPILPGSVVRVTKFETRKHNAGRDRKAAVPESRAGKSTRRNVFSSNAKRVLRAGMRSELLVAASSDVEVRDVGVCRLFIELLMCLLWCADRMLDSAFRLANETLCATTVDGLVTKADVIGANLSMQLRDITITAATTW